MSKRERVVLLPGLLVALLAVLLMPLAIVPSQAKNVLFAQSLRSGVYPGRLASADAFWYKLYTGELSGAPDQSVMLKMTYQTRHPAQAEAVNFQVFSSDALPLWYQGYSEVFMGMGVPAGSRLSGSEQAWSGHLKGDRTYFIRLFNDSGDTVAFRFEVASMAPLTPTMTVTATDVITPMAAPSTPEPAPAVRSGRGIGSAEEEAEWRLIVTAIQGMPASGAATWLKTASRLGWVSLDGVGGLAVGTPAEDAAWNLVVGAIQGVSTQDAVAWLMVAGRMGWLSVHGMNLPAVTSITAAAIGQSAAQYVYPPTNIYPFYPLILRDGPNVGRLAPGGEHWYRFVRSDGDPTTEEYAVFTMFYTPADGANVNRTRFQVFPAGEIELWRRGTPQRMTPMGEGSLVSRDNDPQTGERLWAGGVFDGAVYYLRVFNESPNMIDYYLITGDIRNTELGDRVWAANPVTTHAYQ